MNKILQIIIFLLLFISLNNAQTVYVSDSVTEKNEPINAKNEWEIEPWGKTLHVILDTESKPIEGSIIYLLIDKFSDGKYQPFNSKSINFQNNERRIKCDYKFLETGKYKLYFIDISQRQIASIIVTITEKLKRELNTVKRSNYYDNVKLVFCEKVLVGGTPIGITRRASLSENNGEIFIQITNSSPLKTGVILVDFWRKEHRSFEYDEYIESKKYKVKVNWNDTYFRYKFPKAGEYKIIIYNQAEVLIATGFINVTN
ncbi:MAG: hypothetical protein KKF62_14780 [Bacteroidetes bacterium]|nr:hypothetical protein [Bacteroidota bacterium]MBU1113670.1 hypothetical protein [Bacteroidota bacterium]MBU1796744.1 hypothetical protein [Bacteroidota bacterium]